jgi:DNA replication protein DnaC
MSRIEELASKLLLPRVRASYLELSKHAAEKNYSYVEYLEALFEEEMAGRNESRLKRMIKEARFPYIKTIDEFDFAFNSSLKRQVITNYTSCEFIERGDNFVLCGAAGLGKTHLSIAIGIKAIEKGYSVYFVTATEMINTLNSAYKYERLDDALKPYLKCDLLICDELGYLPYVKNVANLLFLVISGRYEKKSTIITTNKEISSWGEVLYDNSLATSILDRLLHHGEVYYLKGESYRLKDKKRFQIKTTEKQNGEKENIDKTSETTI